MQKCMQRKRLAQRKWGFHARLDSEEGKNDVFRLTTKRQGWKRCAGKKLRELGIESCSTRSWNKKHMTGDWKGGLQRHKIYDPSNEVIVKSRISQTKDRSEHP